MPSAIDRTRHLKKRLDRRRRYQYTICKPYGLCYFRTAKVGTRSFTAWLEAHKDADPEYRNNQVLAFGVMRSYFSFAFVRNPWDRIRSCYVSAVLRGDYFDQWKGRSFEEFLKGLEHLDLDTCDVHLRRQTSLLPSRNLDFLGHFETLEDDVRSLAALTGLDSALFPHLNPSTYGLEAAYTPELVDIVGTLYRSDIESYGYDYVT